MSFCFLYNVVLENYSVQNSPWGGGGSIVSSRSIKFKFGYANIYGLTENSICKDIFNKFIIKEVLQ